MLHMHKAQKLSVVRKFLTTTPSYQPPRIIGSKGLTDDGLRLEYAVNGDLNDYITANPGTSLDQRLRWCRQALSQEARGCINRVMGTFYLMACLESVPSRSYRESMVITPTGKRTFSLSDPRFTSL